MPSLRHSALFIVIFLSGLSACGKTGPLYLPDEKANAATDVRPVPVVYASSEHNH